MVATATEIAETAVVVEPWPLEVDWNNRTIRSPPLWRKVRSKRRSVIVVAVLIELVN